MRSTTIVLTSLTLIACALVATHRDTKPAANAKPAVVKATNPIRAEKPAANAKPAVVKATNPIRAEKPAAIVENPAPAVAAATQTLVPVAPAIAAVMPSITAVPSTWRDYKPASITVAVNGRREEFVQTHVTTGKTATTWTGRSSTGSTLAAVGTPKGWTGRVMSTTGAEHVVTIAGNNARVTNVPAMDSCGSEIVAAYAPAALDATPRAQAQASATASVYVDVMFVTTFESEAILNSQGISDLEAHFRGLIAAANGILEQSLITSFRWRFVAVVHGPTYPITGKIVNDLNQISVRGNPMNTFAIEQRANYGADQVVLICGDDRDANGIAWPYQPQFDLAFAAMGASRGATTLAHELAHGFGCLHDRTTEGVSDTAPGYNYGHYATVMLPFSGGPQAAEFGDVMSYHSPHPYFSNPDLRLTAGDLINHYADYYPEEAKTLVPMGVPEGRPKAADNARWLREHAQALSDLRATTVIDESSAKLVNLSSRTFVGNGDDVQIAGFVISGSAPKTVLVRASGPALTALGVSGALANPRLELHDSAKTIASNDDWCDTAETEISGAAAKTGAFAWTRGSKDSAILTTLAPGAYTAIVSGVGGTTGIALVEVYEVDDNGARLVNVSTRARVESGDGVLIAGFVITGDEAKTVLVRASGPALAALGVSGVLADPVIELHDSTKTIASNDSWSSSTVTSVAKRIGAFAWQSGSKDAALLVTLAPGAYTAVVSGGTGVALVEVYEAR